MQSLALEYLRFADGVEKVRQEREAKERHAELIDMIFKGSLVASQGYEEKVLFEDRFEVENLGDGDADVDLDYSGVDFGTPDESEMEILQRMLADTAVKVPGAPIEGPDAVQVSAPRPDEWTPSIEPPRAVDLSAIEQDSEWV